VENPNGKKSIEQGVKISTQGLRFELLKKLHTGGDIRAEGAGAIQLERSLVGCKTDKKRKEILNTKTEGVRIS